MHGGDERGELLEELRRVCGLLKDRFEFLGSSGVRFLPKAKKPLPCPIALYEGALEGLEAFVPCAAHPFWQGTAFGCWKIGPGAVIWGSPVTGPCRTPFSAEGMDQLGRMLNWLAGEIKAAPPDIEGCHLVAAARCMESGDLAAHEASSKAMPAVEAWLCSTGAKAILLLGDSAKAAFLPGMETALGKAFAKNDSRLLATLSPDEIAAGSQPKRKEAHNHLKAFISLVQP